MKSFTKALSIRLCIVTSTLLIIFSSCKKETDNISREEEMATANFNSHGHLKQTKSFSSEVVIKWISLTNRIQLTPRAAPGVKVCREFAYSGIALYESVVPGMPSYQSLSAQLNQMPQMPSTQPGLAYHWAASANTALAAMNRFFFSTSTTENKAAIDSLETALNSQYQSETDASVFNRSIQFGNDVALKIIEWSNTDGADHAFDPYTPPVGPGLWAPTPPGFGAAAAPYWKDNRTIVQGSIDGAMPPPPFAYSEDPASQYYQTEKEVYDISLSLTPDQTAIGLFWLDNGIQGGGHWLSILKQVLTYENSKLDIAALAYAKGGIYINDATISTFKTKYTYNVQRPISYIRSVLNHPTWNPLFATPAHPDYSSAHTVQSKAIAIAFASIFGQNYQFTDHTFDNLGMSPRTYGSFDATAQEVAFARVYAGIHTRMACEASLIEGWKVAQNINAGLSFLRKCKKDNR